MAVTALLSAVMFGAVVPLGLLFWLWRRTASTRLEWLVGLAGAIGVIAALAVVLPWTVIPLPMRNLYALGALGMALVTWRRVRHSPWAGALGFRRCHRP